MLLPFAFACNCICMHSKFLQGDLAGAHDRDMLHMMPMKLLTSNQTNGLVYAVPINLQ
jgi:hypothetical protein